VGNWLDANPSMGGRLVQGGHEVANHTAALPKLSPPRWRRDHEVPRRAGPHHQRGQRHLDRLPDDSTAARSDAMKAAGDAGYRGVIGFDVGPFDYKDPGKQAVTTARWPPRSRGRHQPAHGPPRHHRGAPPSSTACSRALHPVTLSTLVG
jgi:peptidoglycan/xylan/chitin deacetylase (PgdA/CDA1 family)